MDDTKLFQVTLVAALIIIFLFAGLLVFETRQTAGAQIEVYELEQELKETLLEKNKDINEDIEEQKSEMELLEKRLALLEADIDLWEWEDYVASAYTINDPEQGTTSHNALGWNLKDSRFKEIPQVAVDPKFIPLDSIIQILDNNPESNVSGFYYTADIGGLIKKNRIDILVWDKWLARQIGMRDVMVRIVGKGLTLSK